MNFIGAMVALALSPTLGVPVFSYADSTATTTISANKSANWSGYVADAGSYTSVGGSWIVPNPTTQDTVTPYADATWVGIGGASGRDLIQAGTQAIALNGSFVYEAWYELLPDEQMIVPLAVSAGDSITASLNESSPDVWDISITNNTTGHVYQTSVTYSSSHSSAEWIEEMPIGSTGSFQHFLPLDSFGSIAFSNTYAIKDGIRSTPSQLNAQPITMITGAGDSLASASSLASNGTDFTISRTSAVSTVTYVRTIHLLTCRQCTNIVGSRRSQHIPRRHYPFL